MCKHILNAQVTIRAPCCQRFFDCPQCHAESADHPLGKTTEMAFLCKKCKRAFRKDLTVFEDGDEYCPHCDNHYVIEAKTPAPMLGIEGEDARVDNRMLKDDRMRYDPRRDWQARDQAAQESDRVDQGGWQKALQERGSALVPTDARNADGQKIMDLVDEDLDWS